VERKVRKTILQRYQFLQRYQKWENEKKSSDALRNSSAEQRKQKEEIAQLKLNTLELKEELENVKKKLDAEIIGLSTKGIMKVKILAK
jgi:hypothetical protein